MSLLAAALFIAVPLAAVIWGTSRHQPVTRLTAIHVTVHCGCGQHTDATFGPDMAGLDVAVTCRCCGEPLWVRLPAGMPSVTMPERQPWTGDW